ncbi:MAG TPA: amino acid adenylation domain-containing protein [Acetobacteraceae bacterium]|nr:amino acid adenylation domain-containing protein [Acetobacteraceae bacterium]
MSVTLEASPLIAPLLADRCADAQPAVGFGDTMLSYAELRCATAATASVLRRAGVRPGDRVAICLPKSIGALTAILGTLSIGAAYMPLNHNLPSAQMRSILNDLLPRVVVTDAATAATLAREPLPGLHMLLTEPAVAVPSGDLHTHPGTSPELASPEDLAAILYTSGTTGEPKGIMLSHQNMISFVDWAAETFRVSAADRVTSHAPFNFDLSVFDIFATFRRHATLHLLDDSVVRFPGAIREVLASAGITIWYSVPTALAQLQERRAWKGLDALRTVLFAGEVFPTPVLRSVMADLPQAEFANLYGPTETNVCTWYRIPGPPEAEFNSLPIGRPCAHYEVTLRDDRGRLVGPGAVGEICVTGPGVMLGYWRRPELTATSRIGGRAGSYRTGDLGCWRDDGILILLGRRDQRVKVRGYRIELRALETVLTAHPAVREAVVVATPDATGGRLVAFLSPRGDAADAPDPRDFVAARLAPYYMPDRFEWLSELPHTPNGKADRSALRLRARTLGTS